jgi:hypothetical protein
MDLSFFVPYPQKIVARQKAFPRPTSVRLVADAADAATRRMLAQDLARLAGIRVRPRGAYAIHLKRQARGLRAEGYRLQIGPTQAVVIGADAAGLYYGTQTLLQLAVLGPERQWPELSIVDWPQYAWRSFMADLGRTVYRLPLLQRMIRILARLKMNALHLHLNDDQLNGLRFRKLPLGRENPGAVRLAELKALIQYARRYHVTILPEIECWGHAGSFVYHFPHLRGGVGMYGGSSFGIGPELFTLFEKVFDELVSVLEPVCHVHVGLDEAVWSLLPSVPEAERAKDSTEYLIEKLYEILQRAGRKHGKQVTMHLWADHKGRPVPKQLERELVLHPWRYLQRNREDIRQKLARLGGRGKPRLVCGSGTGQGQEGAHFLSTRSWSREAVKLPNVLGMTICHWHTNDIAEQLIGIYAGADYLWSPATPADVPDDPHDEMLTYRIYEKMRLWQRKMKEGDEDAIRKDRGPLVRIGFYTCGARAGQPAAPTAAWNRQWSEKPGVDG